MQYNQTCGITHSLLSDDIEKEIKLVYLAIPDREHYDSVIEIQVVPSGNNTPNDSEALTFSSESFGVLFPLGTTSESFGVLFPLGTTSESFGVLFPLGTTSESLVEKTLQMTQK
jgi:hypothetical protein